MKIPRFGYHYGWALLASIGVFLACCTIAISVKGELGIVIFLIGSVATIMSSFIVLFAMIFNVPLE